MRLIVGLGNPGIEYQFTPHNMGFLTVDRLADRAGAQVSNRRCKALTAAADIRGNRVLLAKPDTYMNLSGLSVRELVEEYEVDVSRDLLVIYDELDLALGTLRIRERGSSAGHNGMESIIGALGTQEFPRIRMGIHPGHALNDGARYVTSQFKKAQYPMLDEFLEKGADAVETILTDGIAKAMNRFNQKNAGEADGESAGK